MAANKVVFLTGATGLVGSYLLRLLLREGNKVFVLSRRKDNKGSRDRVIDVLKFWDEDILSELGDKLFVVEGDITKKNLGLNKHNLELLENEVEEIFHSAAVTQFNQPLEKVRNVNVEGTENVLDVAVKCREKGRLKKVNHISTAYVCGDYEGIFQEDDLDVGQSFDSTYEQSKFEAEKLIESHREKGLWIDIFRPSLVLGESITGKTTTFQQSPYQLLHMWNMDIFEYFPAKGFYFNAVFVDDLCNALIRVASSTSSVNKNWHLFNGKRVSFERFLNNSSKYIGFTEPKLVSLDEFFKKNPSPAQKMLLEHNILMFNSNVQLDSAMTNKVLKEYGFEFSGLDKISLSNMLDYCVKEGFLKKRHV